MKAIKPVNIKTIKPTDSVVYLVLIKKSSYTNICNEQSRTSRMYALEAERIKILNKNIEEAKKALDTFSHQHQSILYRLRNLFRHAN